MMAIMAILAVAMLCVASYGFGWYYRGAYEAPYIKQMRDTLRIASTVFDDYADQHEAKPLTPDTEAKALRNRRLARSLHDATCRPDTIGIALTD